MDEMRTMAGYSSGNNYYDLIFDVIEPRWQYACATNDLVELCNMTEQLISCLPPNVVGIDYFDRIVHEISKFKQIIKNYEITPQIEVEEARAKGELRVYCMRVHHEVIGKMWNFGMIVPKKSIIDPNKVAISMRGA
jgi:predicted metal-binding protein